MNPIPVSSSYCLPASVLGTVNTAMNNIARAANDLPPESLHSLVAGVGVGSRTKICNEQIRSMSDDDKGQGEDGAEEEMVGRFLALTYI